MAVYRVQTPNGVLRIEGPDNASESDLLATAQQHAASQSPAYDPTEGMSTFDKAAAGVGSGLADLYQGAKERLGYATPQDVAEKRALDAPLMNTNAGRFGNFAGQAIPALATLPIPGLNTVAGAAATGGVLGYLQPTAPGEDVGRNTFYGTVGGGVGQGAANLVGRLVAPVRGALNPEEQRLAQVMADNGVNLDLAQKTGSKPLRILNSIFDNLPITSGREEAKKAAQAQAFTRAVLAKSGTIADQATPEVIDQNLSRIGGTIGDVAKRNSINIDGPLVKDLINTYDKYQNVLEPNQRAVINNNINAILAERGVLNGDTYQATRSTLGKLTKSTDPNVVQAAKDIRGALDDAATRSINGEDLAAWQEARQQYANLMPVAKAMKSTAGISGDIPPLQFRTEVANANPRNYVRGKGDLNDLSRAGAMFLSNPVPNSGTAQRMFYQGLLTQLGGAAALGGGTYAGTGDVTKSLGAASAGLLGPVVAQKALSNGMLGNYLAAGPARTYTAEEIRRLLGPALVGAGALAYRPQ